MGVGNNQRKSPGKIPDRRAEGETVMDLSGAARMGVFANILLPPIGRYASLSQ